MLFERRLQLVGIKIKLRRIERHIYRLGARKNRVRTVVFIERRENNHLVARVGHGHHCRYHRLGAAAGDDYFRIGVDAPAHELRLLLGERLSEILCAPGYRILMIILVRNLGKAVEDFFGRIKIRESLRQIDRAVLQRDSRHSADDRIGEIFCSAGKFRHVFSP